MDSPVTWLSIARMPRNAMTIARAPMSGGMSAATTPRKTHRDSAKRIGKAIISARARSSETWEPIWGPTTSPPPSRTSRPRSAVRKRSAAASASASGSSWTRIAVAEPSRETKVASRVAGQLSVRATAGSRRRAASASRTAAAAAWGTHERHDAEPGLAARRALDALLCADALRAGVLEVAALARELIGDGRPEDRRDQEEGDGGDQDGARPAVHEGGEPAHGTRSALAGLPPDLHGDLLDRQRDRR